ncbi:MAG TPA: GDSL-type esterase/lipase family protein [Microbacterium sp.]|nr:GDSL-type esterase/lipase family protein [Microbacterium sp.]
MSPRARRTSGRGRAVLSVLGSTGLAATVVAGGALLLLRAWAQDRPARYEKAVARIGQRFAGGYPVGGVLLTGSSFFERWKTSAEDLAPLPTVNIGIGGTKVGDHLAHVDRMVAPFQPRAVVVYVGSNDMSGLPLYSKSAVQTVELVERYLAAVRERLPHARIYYVAVTEAPSRAKVRGDIVEANRLLAERAAATGDFVFIETASELLRPDGSIDESLFGRDRLHFNEAGYARFAAAVRRGLAPEFREVHVEATP